MTKQPGGEKIELRQLRVTFNDELARLEALCRLGGLAADGMHGMHENPSATAFSCYFNLLGTEIEKLRRNRGTLP